VCIAATLDACRLLLLLLLLASPLDQVAPVAVLVT
jgi:hypothetical protein